MIVRYHIQILKNMVHILRIKDITVSAEGSAKDKTLNQKLRRSKLQTSRIIQQSP